MIYKCIAEKYDWPIVARNTPHTSLALPLMNFFILKPTPFILSTLKSLWTTHSPSKVNLPQFIYDLDNMLAYQTHFVKKALASKHASHRLSREAKLAAVFKTGDIVYRSPGINKCLDASWEGPFIISQLLPPVNCSIVPQGKKSKPKNIHLSQLKKAAPIYRALIVPDEHVTDDFLIPSNTPQQ